MSCLLDTTLQDQLRDKIVKELTAKAESKTPINLTDYIHEVYNDVKETSSNETLAVDSARLVPVMLKQLFLLPEFSKLLKSSTPNIEADNATLESKLSSVANVSLFLGLDKSPIELIGNSDTFTITPIVQPEEPEVQLSDITSTNNYVSRTVAVEATEDKQKNLVFNENLKHAFTVMHAVQNELFKQRAEDPSPIVLI